MQRPTLNKNSAAVVAESPAGTTNGKKIGTPLSLPQNICFEPKQALPTCEKKVFLHKDPL